MTSIKIPEWDCGQPKIGLATDHLNLSLAGRTATALKFRSAGFRNNEVAAASNRESFWTPLAEDADVAAACGHNWVRKAAVGDGLAAPPMSD